MKNGSGICDVLYAADVSVLGDGTLFSRALDLIPAERRRRAERMPPAEARLSVGAALLLRAALCAAGMDPERERVISGPNGKPCFESGAFCFNLSHSGTTAVCAVSGREVGCDVERIGDGSRALSVSRRFFTPEEDARVRFAGGAEGTELFFRYWTLKESFLKVTGRGLSRPMDSFAVRFDNGLPLPLEEEGRKYYFREYRDLPGYCCSVCTENGLFEGEPQFLCLAELC